MRTIKRLTPHHWDQLKSGKKAKEAIKIPWSLFKRDSGLVSAFTDFKESSFRDFKIFLLAQHEFMFIDADKAHIDVEEDLDRTYLYDMSKFNRFKLNPYLKTKANSFQIELQYVYRIEATKEGFIYLPYKVFDKVRGKLAMLVEAVLYSFDKIRDAETLWRAISSILGAKEFPKSKVIRYLKRSRPHLVTAGLPERLKDKKPEPLHQPVNLVWDHRSPTQEEEDESIRLRDIAEEEAARGEELVREKAKLETPSEKPINAPQSEEERISELGGLNTKTSPLRGDSGPSEGNRGFRRPEALGPPTKSKVPKSKETQYSYNPGDLHEISYRRRRKTRLSKDSQSVSPQKQAGVREE